MAFGNITTLYFPTAANAGTSQWGSDVRKLLDSADAASDNTTITNHGTGGAVTRTEDPYTTSTADLTEADYGWAVTPTDMNSVSGALRFIPAGDHVFTGVFNHNGATAGTGTLTMYIYRIANAAGSRARTLITSGNASVSLPALSGAVTATVTVSVSEIIFEADETLQYSFEFNVAGIAITGRLVRMFTGTQTAVATRVDMPGLKVLADTTGTASGTCTVDGVTGKVLGATGTSSGTSTVTGSMSSRWDTVGTASGSGTASGQMSSVYSFTGTAAGTSTVSGLTSIVLGTVGTATVGGGTTPVSPDFVMTTDGDLEKLVADIEPYPLYLKL